MENEPTFYYGSTIYSQPGEFLEVDNYPLRPGSKRLIGLLDERDSKYKKLARLDNQMNRAKNPFHNINYKIYFSLFGLTETQQSSIRYLFVKKSDSFIGRKPYLLAALFYQQGIDISEICEIMSVYHTIIPRLLLKTFYELDMKRVRVTNCQYFAIKDLNRIPLPIRRKIHNPLWKLLKYYKRGAPSVYVRGCLYLLVKGFQLTQLQLATLLELEEWKIRDGFDLVRKTIHIPGTLTMKKSRQILRRLEKQ